ncbi:MAG: asparagine synthase (glutamine-hydrolyzing) [Nanoarchaeota archaeon]|nr:asparagine synthase (glutamine-hydrolyzing) [Nanoarchaeota archaeon]
MCGISGVLNFDGTSPSQKVIDEMTDSLKHRGPDGRGIFIAKNVALGHRRLKILDLSEQGAQPMKTEKGEVVISYNGEIYNFKEIRNELEKKGYTFKSTTDTEVILYSYKEWGIDCIKKFNGMFAFAIYDLEKEKLYLGRDRYGIKPLYYFKDDKMLLFASEVKAFLNHPGFKVELDKETLLEYFTFQNIFSNKTLFKGVKLIQPGNFAEVLLKGGSKLQFTKYWDFKFQEEKNPKTEEEYIQELDILFKNAVKRQIVSDVEVGTYLSGGVDSGSITALAAQTFPNLKTFCIGFDTSTASGIEFSFDERKKAEHLSYLYQTEHYEMVLKSGDLQRCLPELVWHLEDLRIGQSYPNFYASKLASKFVKVCLSGTGGDEFFAGYPWRYYNSIRSENFDEYVEKYYQYWQRLVPNKTIKKLFSPIWDEVKNVFTQEIFKNTLTNNNHHFTPETPEEYINNSLYFEAKTFLHGLLIVEDKLNMAHGLESRVPLLDNDLVDFAMKLPVKLKLNNLGNVIKMDENELNKFLYRNKDGKVILRKVFGNYVPSEVAHREKQGFSGPDASWFKGESLKYIETLLLNKKSNIFNYFNYETVQELIQEHMGGKQNHRLFIWSLLCFEHWCKIWLNGEDHNDLKEL